MTPADLQIPERGSAPVEDPAVVAGKEAAAAFDAMTGDEPGPVSDAVQERSSKADSIFADAPVTSAAGALAKMEELRATVMSPTIDPDETYLDARHFKTVVAFLEAVVGGKVAPIGDHPDAELLARVAEFYPALEKHNIASEAWDAGRAEADAMPDCPPLVAPAFDKAGHDRWKAFMKAKGVDRLCEKSNAAGRAMGKAAKRVFATPARTYRGAIEKVKIAYLATGDGEGTGTSDDDLEAYQDIKNPWMANAIADLERLAVVPPTVTEPDPAVVALAEYRVAKAADDAISNEDAEAETLEYKATGDRLYAARDVVYNAVPTSMAGMAAKIRFLFDHGERGNDLWPLFDTMAKSMLPFLEGGAAVAPPTTTAPDPAVVAFEELKAAWAAFDALDCDATYKRYAEARDAVNHAVPVSLAGVHAKVRALLEPYRTDPDAGGFDQDHDISAKAMLPFLEGTPSPAPKPDPVAVLFAQWGDLQDEIIAFGKAHPDSEGHDVEKQRDKLCRRQSAVEDQIIETATTSVGGMAVKLRLLAYMKFPMKGLPELHRTPAKDTDFGGFVAGRRDDGGLFLDDKLLIDTLRDAERLAGVS